MIHTFNGIDIEQTYPVQKPVATACILCIEWIPKQQTTNKDKQHLQIQERYLRYQYACINPKGKPDGSRPNSKKTLAKRPLVFVA